MQRHRAPGQWFRKDGYPMPSTSKLALVTQEGKVSTEQRILAEVGAVIAWAVAATTLDFRGFERQLLPRLWTVGRLLVQLFLGSSGESVGAGKARTAVDLWSQAGWIATKAPAKGIRARPGPTGSTASTTTTNSDQKYGHVLRGHASTKASEKQGTARPQRPKHTHRFCGGGAFVSVIGCLPSFQCHFLRIHDRRSGI